MGMLFALWVVGSMWKSGVFSDDESSAEDEHVEELEKQ